MVRALWSLVANDDANKAELVGETGADPSELGITGFGGIAAILGAMEKHPEHHELQTAGCMVLWFLIMDPKQKCAPPLPSPRADATHAD